LIFGGRRRQKKDLSPPFSSFPFFREIRTNLLQRDVARYNFFYDLLLTTDTRGRLNNPETPAKKQDYRADRLPFVGNTIENKFFALFANIP